MTLRMASMGKPPGEPEHNDPGAEAPGANTPLNSPFAPGGTDTALGGPSRFGAAGKHSGVLVLLIVVVAASGSLYAMRRMGKAGHLKMLDIKIDYPVEGATRIATSDHVVLMNDLRTTGEVPQVPLDEVQMNPFEWRGLEVVTTVPGGRSIDPAEAARLERERRAAQINDAFKRLSLNSVIGGRIPVARISGQMVRVGDTVGEFFRVTEIGGREARLEADGRVFTLSLGE
ncbi:MAG TPA: hypothetical protein DEB06_05080 [Phycisphaerales bacterium]|nr:hypothetical protein [Phycisphaerales bacterium]